MLESTEKLKRKDYHPGYRGEPTLEMMADVIQAEVDEKYMLLPVDADGVPIRPGDQMTDYSQRIDNLGIAKWDVVSVNECAFFDMSHGLHIASQHHHVKQRTLEDVLDEYECVVVAKHCSGCGADKMSKLEEKQNALAAEIRELMGGAE